MPQLSLGLGSGQYATRREASSPSEYYENFKIDATQYTKHATPLVEEEDNNEPDEEDGDDVGEKDKSVIDLVSDSRKNIQLFFFVGIFVMHFNFQFVKSKIIMYFSIDQ